MWKNVGKIGKFSRNFEKICCDKFLRKLSQNFMKILKKKMKTFEENYSSQKNFYKILKCFG